ncbi:MAG: hypothetical protein RBT49_01190 [Bacteroidales bacterium]|jgi:hypothetical protein|nr:hypothetical protein [Bacteroidales bacterium]
MLTNVKKISYNPNEKRRLASLEGCKVDLKEDLPLMFKAFNQAFAAYESEVVQTPPEARARGFEASLLNSKMIQSIQSNFPINWKFGKYRRFTLRIKGYIVLFKKFDNRGLPMNIITKSVTAISQQLSLSLFDEVSFVAEPILFFGYRKDKMGNIADPKLVYIDEDKIKWTITHDEILTIKTTSISKEEKVAKPKFKESINKKAVNE